MNVYEIYRKAREQNVILSFRGNVTEDFMASVFLVMESRLEGTSQQQRIRKKVNTILVECLQNVYHHMDEFPGDAATDEVRSAIFLICRDASNRYSIITGNPILTTHVEPLKNKIDKVNAMTREELKQHYQDSLGNSELSAKGGAGLGMIDMARKSGNRIEYQFEPVDDKLSFFSLIVTID